MRLNVAIAAGLGLLVLGLPGGCKRKPEPAPGPAATNMAPVAVETSPPPVLVTFRADDLPPLSERFAADDNPDLRYGPSRRYPAVPGADLQRGQRIFVMEETNAWVRIRITEEAGPSLGWINKFASLPAMDTDTNLTVQAADVEILREVGLVAEVRAELNEALVHTNVWNGESMAVKRGVGRTLAHYCGLKKGSNTRWVQLVDADSGQRLARYSESSGYTDFSSLRRTDRN
jgi:SH3-like domain-containing protein